MSLCRDMMPPWELRAEMERLTVENERLTAEVVRLREALEVLSDHYKSRYGDCTRGGVISAVEQIARAALKKESI